MKLSLWIPLGLVSVLIIAFGAIACGDDDEKKTDTATGGATRGAALSAEAYIGEVNEIQDGVTNAADAVGARSEQAFGDPARARSALTAAADVGESAKTSLEALDPPSDATAIHEELIAAGEELVAAVQSYSDRLTGAEVGPEFDKITEEAEAPDSDLSKAIERMGEACRAVQAYADENNVQADLSCPEAP
jgi:ABC-type transporter Mla subunit MlaD